MAGALALSGLAVPKRRRQAQVTAARQVHFVDDVALRHGGGAVDAVFQLAHVAGEVTSLQGLQRLGGDAHLAAVFLVELLQEVVGQQRDVAMAFAQGRQEDGDDVQAEVKVGAELALGHRHFQIAVGGGDQTDVDLDGLGAADPFELAFLQDAQQLGLEIGGNLADFVQEKRAAIGQFETTLAVGHGAGESALFMAEQFGLQHAFRQSRAVDLDERLVGPLGQHVDGVGDHFLAGAAFAAQQHGGLGRRRLLHLGEHPTHGVGRADDVFQSGGPRCRLDLDDLLLQPGVVFHQLFAVGQDLAIKPDGLADQGADHGQEADVVLEAAQRAAFT